MTRPAAELIIESEEYFEWQFKLTHVHKKDSFPFIYPPDKRSISSLYKVISSEVNDTKNIKDQCIRKKVRYRKLWVDCFIEGNTNDEKDKARVSPYF